MIIEVKFNVTDPQMQALRSDKPADIEVALEIFGQMQRAVQRGSLNVYEWIEDHKTDDNGQLVSAGWIEVKLDN